MDAFATISTSSGGTMASRGIIIGWPRLLAKLVRLSEWIELSVLSELRVLSVSWSLAENRIERALSAALLIRGVVFSMPLPRLAAAAVGHFRRPLSLSSDSVSWRGASGVS